MIKKLEDIKESWERLSEAEQEIYLNKARFLVENSYIQDQDIEKLAIKIYDNEVK